MNYLYLNTLKDKWEIGDEVRENGVWLTIPDSWVGMNIWSGRSNDDCRRPIKELKTEKKHKMELTIINENNMSYTTKEIMQHVEEQLSMKDDLNNKQAKYFINTINESCASLCAQGKKILAIRLFRMIFPCDLPTAKQYVEHITEMHKYHLGIS